MGISRRFQGISLGIKGSSRSLWGIHRVPASSRGSQGRFRIASWSLTGEIEPLKGSGGLQKISRGSQGRFKDISGGTRAFQAGP